MTETITTDIFKFVAVRPPQRVTESETRRTIIRDPRAATPQGVQELRELARELASPGAALARWRELDSPAAEPLAEGFRALVRLYEQMDADTDPPEGLDLLKEVGTSRARDWGDEELLRFAWDSLYVAERTGADAGPRLETPLAALRLLHFIQLLGEETHPTRAAALEALRATPAIPTAFHEAIPTPVAPTPELGNDTLTNQPDALAHNTRVRDLAREIHNTERLLEAVRSAPPLTMPPIQAVAKEETGGWTRSQFSFGTVPALSSALAGQLSRDQALLLDRLRVAEATPVSVAAQMLQTHLSKLSGQAFALGDDHEFQSYLRELKGPATAFNYVGASDIVPGVKSLPDDTDSALNVDVSGRIIPLGIGDLKVVKQTLLAYVPGEVAHIENVLKKESKERKHRKLDRTETTLFISEEETNETERDTQSTERFELKREAEQTIKEDMSIKAGLTVTATFGPVVTTATGDFAYSTSKQDSQKSSSNFARELVDRSVSKLQKKTKTERTTKTLSEVEEINTHGVNNTEGDDHVIGIYRWVDKRYRAQVYNYGVRMLLEFVIPEPAAFYRAALRRPKDVNVKPPAAFVSFLTGQPLTVADITETDYLGYASRYNTPGVTPPPPGRTHVGIALVEKDIAYGQAIGISSEKFIVPEGYSLGYYSATVTILWGHGAKFSLQVGRDSYPRILDVPHSDPNAAKIKDVTSGLSEEIWPSTGSVPISIGAYDVRAFAVNVQGIGVLTAEHLDKWKLQTFDKIYAAYQALQTEYDQKVAQAEASAGITIEGRNPSLNRFIEKTELKKLCITMMTGQHFKQFDAMTDPVAPKHPEVEVYEALSEGRIVQFFEQAFEWEQMTYLFYPYFWGRKKNWIAVTHMTDQDPLFAQFLTAGSARVVVPVPLAYIDAVQFLLQSKETTLGKKVWRGGERPTIEDPLYVSIAEEMRNQTDDLAGATPEGEPWEFTLPTTLVWLQPDGELPTFEPPDE